MENDLRYPIGKFEKPETITTDHLLKCQFTLKSFPSEIKKAVDGLNDNQLNTVYREGGWSIRQVVHHCADSHMNALIRFKLALTEDAPTIKPYQENLWAELNDYKMPIRSSLQLIEAVHEHWTNLCQSFNELDYQKTYVHPEYKTVFTLSLAITLYDWHCRHHLAHIVNLKTSRGW